MYAKSLWMRRCAFKIIFSTSYQREVLFKHGQTAAMQVKEKMVVLNSAFRSLSTLVNGIVQVSVEQVKQVIMDHA